MSLPSEQNRLGAKASTRSEATWCSKVTCDQTSLVQSSLAFCELPSGFKTLRSVGIPFAFRQFQSRVTVVCPNVDLGFLRIQSMKHYRN